VANRTAQTIARGQLSSEELLRTLRDAKMDLSGSEDDKKGISSVRFGHSLRTAKVTDVSGTAGTTGS